MLPAGGAAICRAALRRDRTEFRGLENLPMNNQKRAASLIANRGIAGLSRTAPRIGEVV